jgi:hypothetical protein
MLRCAWCMKKIEGNKPVFGLGVKFAEGVKLSDDDGKIKQIVLASRKTSVPLLIAGKNSKAQQQGVDGIFSLCSGKCFQKMKDSLNQELELFKEVSDVSLQ